jgi:hypothetical protein
MISSNYHLSAQSPTIQLVDDLLTHNRRANFRGISFLRIPSVESLEIMGASGQDDTCLMVVWPSMGGVPRVQSCLLGQVSDNIQRLHHGNESAVWIHRELDQVRPLLALARLTRLTVHR